MELTLYNGKLKQLVSWKLSLYKTGQLYIQEKSSTSHGVTREQYSYVFFLLLLFLLLFSYFFHSPFFFLSSPLYSCLFILIFIAVLLPVEFLGIFCSLLLISSPLLSWNFDFWECLYYSNCLLCIQCGRG